RSLRRRHVLLDELPRNRVLLRIARARTASARLSALALRRRLRRGDEEDEDRTADGAQEHCQWHGDRTAPRARRFDGKLRSQKPAAHLPAPVPKSTAARTRREGMARRQERRSRHKYPRSSTDPR